MRLRNFLARVERMAKDDPSLLDKPLSAMVQGRHHPIVAVSETQVRPGANCGSTIVIDRSVEEIFDTQA